MSFDFFYEECRLCPRQCGTNRLSDGHASRTGFCGETDQLRVAYAGPHFGEEPPITGKNGSGTIFFSGCTLRCSYCQNYQISHGKLGKSLTTHQLFQISKDLILGHRVHNINLVTPDHFLPHVFKLVSLLRQNGHELPMVYNLSGYQSVNILKYARNYTDIYLPDFKYADSGLASMLSGCGNYAEVALEAIAEMVRQKGFLDACRMSFEIAGKGVLVRHLILPGFAENSVKALTTLFVEFGPGLPISLMSQYSPVMPQKNEALNRPVSRSEFDRVYDHAMGLGFESLFVQFPDEGPGSEEKISPFLPDFRQKEPFG